jgi:hypothetical protein
MQTLADAALKIDWTKVPTYNTIMSLAVGCGLLLLVALGCELLRGRELSTDGYGIGFGVLGLVLTITGAHMTLTWPLAALAPFDDIIFGETGLAFGLLMLAAAFYLWRRGTALTGDDGMRRAARVATPVSVFVFALGLALFAITAAGLRYRLFAAPPQEPISGMFAEHPIVEATFMSCLIALVGVGAVLFPFGLATRGRIVLGVIGAVWTVAGVVFVLFGALNFFTHIGLVINTM